MCLYRGYTIITLFQPGCSGCFQALQFLVPTSAALSVLMKQIQNPKFLVRLNCIKGQMLIHTRAFFVGRFLTSVTSRLPYSSAPKITKLFLVYVSTALSFISQDYLDKAESEETRAERIRHIYEVIAKSV